MIKEFKCNQCENQYEKIFHTYYQFLTFYSENPNCEKCGERLEVMISQTARPKFKGTGFYETDYK